MAFQAAYSTVWCAKAISAIRGPVINSRMDTDTCSSRNSASSRDSNTQENSFRNLGTHATVPILFEFRRRIEKERAWEILLPTCIVGFWCVCGSLGAHTHTSTVSDDDDYDGGRIT